MKIQYINNLRAVACLLVILTHSAMPSVNANLGIYMVLFSIIGSPSSELFVLISSSLLAPTKLDMLSFYKKRFSKLIGPFFTWSVIVLALKYFQHSISGMEMIQSILLFPFVPVTGIYWFVYAICGLYLIIPLISPWLAACSKKELQVIICLWAITLVLPYFNKICNTNFYDITGDYYFILSYVGGFLGYLFLGVYLKRYPVIIPNKLKALLIIALLVSVGSIPILFSYLKDRSLLVIAEDNLSIGSAFYVIGIFIFFQNFKLSKHIEFVFNEIAKYSFGIYLMHIIIVRDVVWLFFENNRIPHPLLETPLIAIISTIICYLIVKFLTLFPKSQYYIGA